MPRAERMNRVVSKLASNLRMWPVNRRLRKMFEVPGCTAHRFYLLVESTGISELLPSAEPRLGRRTVLTFPLLPPPQKN